MSRRLLAVALHDVEPRWSERVREVRAWLAERGVERVTLLAIPAPGAERRPLPSQDPALAAWLAVRVAAGDAVVQHGRRLSPLAVRAGAQLVGDVLRLDVHPADFDRPAHVAALEAVLDAASADRDPVAYDELAAA